MTTTAGQILVNQILPLISAAIAHGAVKPTGCEDAEELRAEAVALAAKALESAENRGKDVPANSVAFYAVQSLKRGRRSGYSGKADVLSAAATLCGRVSVQSMDKAIGVVDDDPDHEVTLHDAIASNGEDTDVAAARQLDWDDVLGRLDDRRRTVLQGTAAGRRTDEMAHDLNVTPPRICQLRESIGSYIVSSWGSNGLGDLATPSKWRAGLRATAERRAGRAERARAR